MPCLRRLRAIASVLTEINSAAAEAGSVLADACNLLISVFCKRLCLFASVFQVKVLRVTSRAVTASSHAKSRDAQTRRASRRAVLMDEG